MSQENYSIEILDSNTLNHDLSYKIILVGDSGVGKSCLSIRGTKDVFEPVYSATVGFEFMAFFVKINEKIIKLQIWDTCGEEVYRSLISSFYKNSSLVIMVYSIDNMHSFSNLEFWLNEIRTKSNPDINVFLIGNKCDLENMRKISKEEGQQFCDNNKLKLFIETSAKTGFNSQNLFIEAAKVLYKDSLKKQNRIPARDSSENVIIRDKYNIPMEEERNIKRKKCC